MVSDAMTKWLWDNRRSVLGWTLAVSGVGGMYAAFWPSIDNPEMRAALEAYPSEVMEAINYTDVSTPAAYLNATVFGLIVAVLVVVYSVSVGARLIAGDEDAGTLDLVLAHPISRVRLAFLRFFAFEVSVVVIVLGLFLFLLALTGPAGLDGVTAGSLMAMSLHLVLFAILFGSVSFAVGAATGRRSLAVGVGAGLAILGFAANGVLPQIEGLEWSQDFSPFHWLNGELPLVNGVDWQSVLVMSGLALTLVLVGLWTFDRRDVGV